MESFGFQNEEQLRRIIREEFNEAIKALENRPAPYAFYYSPETVAKLLDLDPDTIRTWCNKREIKASKFGRIWRIKQKDFDKYCKERGW